MKDSDEDSTRPARVFVSYSRTDLGHAGEIAAGLRFAGFSVLIDEESIERGEAWKAKLEQLIVSADVIVFMVSPQFVKSEMCAWELDRAIENGKRLVPVLLEETTGVPGELASLNYVRFDEGRSFIAGLETLSRTLKVDLSWIHDHTRLQQRALDWKAAGAEENRLLIGVDVADALNWLEAASSDLPPVTDDQRAFIRASSEAETRRQSEERKRLEAVRKAQRRLGWALAGGCVAVLAGLSLGIVQARANAMNKATVQVAFADLSLLEGRYDSAMRVAASGLAELEPFWNPESPALEIRLRAAAALTPHIASGGQPELSELVDKLAAERRLSPVDRTRLQRLMDRNPEDGQLRPASTIRLTSPDRKRRLSVSSGSGSIQLQNLESSTDGPVPITDITDHRGALLAAAFTPDSRLIVTSDRNGAMVFRETLTGSVLGGMDRIADRIVFDQSGRFMRTWDRETNTFSVFDIRNLLRAARPNESLAEAYTSADGNGVLVRSNLREPFQLFAPAFGVYGDETTLTASYPAGSGFLWQGELTAMIETEDGIRAWEDCPAVVPHSMLSPSWAEHRENARDWGVHSGLDLIVVVFEDGQPPAIFDSSGSLVFQLPGLGSEVLDAKFDCGGEHIHTIDEAGRFLSWSLRVILDIPSSELRNHVCNHDLVGDVGLVEAERAFAVMQPCTSVR